MAQRERGGGGGGGPGSWPFRCAIKGCANRRVHAPKAGEQTQQDSIQRWGAIGAGRRRIGAQAAVPGGSQRSPENVVPGSQLALAGKHACRQRAQHDKRVTGHAAPVGRRECRADEDRHFSNNKLVCRHAGGAGQGLRETSVAPALLQEHACHAPRIFGPPRTICASTAAAGCITPAATTAAQPVALFCVALSSTASRPRRQSCGRAQSSGRTQAVLLSWAAMPWLRCHTKQQAVNNLRQRRVPPAFFLPSTCSGWRACTPVLASARLPLVPAHLLDARNERLPRQQLQLLHQPAHKACKGGRGHLPAG